MTEMCLEITRSSYSVTLNANGKLEWIVGISFPFQRTRTLRFVLKKSENRKTPRDYNRIYVTDVDVKYVTYEEKMPLNICDKHILPTTCKIEPFSMFFF